MQYFGVPTCPYCKKRVNLIRTWSLKRQGEYRCPRCGGISNIFLSPLIYVFALLAVFAGGAVYFFHKFILDDISITTAIQVIIPFAIFFLISLFMVYLAKPVIKKVSRAELEGKKRGKLAPEDRRRATTQPMGQTGQVFYDNDDYIPPVDYRTGPMPIAGEDGDIKIHIPEARAVDYTGQYDSTSVIDIKQNNPYENSPRELYTTGEYISPGEYTSSGVPATPVSRSRPQQSVRRPQSAEYKPQSTSPARQRQVVQPDNTPVSRREEAGASRVVSSVDIPQIKDDFFAKYDDPEYIERRLREMKQDRE